MEMTKEEMLDIGMKMAGLDHEACLVAKAYMMGVNMASFKEAVEKYDLLALLKSAKSKAKSHDNK